MSVIAAHRKGLSDEDRRDLDALLVEFNQSWDENKLETWLPRLPTFDQSVRPPALAEVVVLDMENRWKHGLQVDLEWYLQRIPELGSKETVAPELILAEYQVRKRFAGLADL